MKELESRDPRALNIAHRYLNVTSKDFLDEPWPFVAAGEWMDNIKGTGWKHYHPIHFTNVPVYAPDFEGIAKNITVNATWAYDNAVATLRAPDTKYNLLSKSIAVRVIVHLVGDIHQPLHTSALFSKQFKKGDIGGNAFKIKYTSKLSNLHAFWDALGHNHGNIEVPLNKSVERQTRLVDLCKNITSQYPRSDLIKMPQKHTMFDDWVAEAHVVAKEHAYRGISPGDKPTDAYVANTRTVCDKQLALAGYRIADAISDIFKNVHLAEE